VSRDEMLFMVVELVDDNDDEADPDYS